MKYVKDSLGNRMKGYENENRHYISKKAYTILRLDGRSFSRYTKGLERPFDDDFISDMNDTASHLCSKITGVKMAICSSDEISLVLTDFEHASTDMFFGGNIQKICSIAASIASNKFNQLRLKRSVEKTFRYFSQTIRLTENDIYNLSSEYIDSFKLAEFDCRVLQVPNREEVENYLIWRQQDTIRNAVQSVAQSLYSHKELDHKNTKDLIELCKEKNVNFDEFHSHKRMGRLIQKYTNEETGRSYWKHTEETLKFVCGCDQLTIIPTNILIQE